MRKVLSLSVLALLITAMILQMFPLAYAEHNPHVYWTKTGNDILAVSGIVWPRWLDFTIESTDIPGEANPIVQFKFVIEKNETGYARFHYNQSKHQLSGWSATPDEFDPDGWPTVIIFAGPGIAEKHSGWFAIQFIWGPSKCNYKFALYTIDSGSPPVTKLSWLYLIIDSTKPTVKITSPENGACIGGNLVWIKATAEDLGDPKHISGVQSVTLYLNNIAYEMEKVTAKDFYWHGAPPTTEARYEATVVAFDAAGNSESDTVSFIWDNVSHPIEIYPPDIEFYPKPEVGADLTVCYDWAGEDKGDPFLEYFEVMDNATGVWINNGKNKCYKFVDVALGWHRIHVRYFDCALNTFEKSVDVEVWPTIRFNVEPNSGTVGPETTMIGGLVVGSKVTVDGKTLGTEVTVSGCFFTENSKIDVTVSVPSYHWYYNKYETYELSVASATTDDTGNFETSFLFPTAPQGIYRIKVKDTEGLEREAWFTVVPEIAYKPAVVIGPAVIEVMATGLPAGGEVDRFTVDDTDALVRVNRQAVLYWETDGNGTLYTTMAEKPGFLMPVLEPGTYEIAIRIRGGTEDGYWTTTVSNDVYVVNEFKDLMDAIDDLELKLDDIKPRVKDIQDKVIVIETTLGDIEAKLDDLDPLIVDIKDEVATIKTVVGDIELKLDDLDPLIVDIKDEVATIETTAGEIKVNVNALKTTVTAIEGKVATIETSVGVNLKGTVERIDGDVATVKTDVGEIKARVPEDLKDMIAPTPTTLNITAVLAAIAAIASIVAVVVVLRRLKVAA